MSASLNAYYARRTKQQRGTRPSLKAIWILLCLLMFMGAGMAGVSLYTKYSHPKPTTSPATKTYTVHQGDTVWSIAESVNTNQEQNVWNIIDQIEQLNGMQDVTIQPGQVLKIPVDGR